MILAPNRILWGAALLFLAACAPASRRSGPLAPDVPEFSNSPVNSRIIFVIHGDADYTWHDSSGMPLSADVEALRQALAVARQDTTAEVFVFHQKAGGRFAHYRAGRLQSQQTYKRSRTAFEAEARLLREGNPDTAQVPSILVYFGHEVPMFRQGGYDASRSGTPFSVADFSAGLARLSDRRFDLLVLSACYGGNPVLMGELAARARYAVASPAYLHLSYLDAGALGDPRSTDGAIEALADSIARQSFDRLTATTQTEVTVGIYDLDKTSTFLNSALAESQAAELQAAQVQTGKDTRVWKDCSNDPAFDSTAAAEGIRLYYRAPRFGPPKNQATRSAWECRL